MKKLNKIKKVIDTIYFILILVNTYVCFVGVQLNRMELAIPPIVCLPILFIIWRHINSQLRAKAKRILFKKKYQRNW